MMHWIVERLNERSTWLGLISLAGAVGLALDPDQADAIVAAFTRD